MKANQPPALIFIPYSKIHESKFGSSELFFLCLYLKGKFMKANQDQVIFICYQRLLQVTSEYYSLLQVTTGSNFKVSMSLRNFQYNPQRHPSDIIDHFHNHLPAVFFQKIPCCLYTQHFLCYCLNTKHIKRKIIQST